MIKSRYIIIALLALVWACGGGETQTETDPTALGKKLYKTQCSICHGDDGRKGLSGAKLIPESALDVKQRITLITKGKGNMMPYAGILSEEEIEAVAAYTMTLK